MKSPKIHGYYMFIRLYPYMCDQFVTFFLTSSFWCDSLQVLEESNTWFRKFFEQHLYNRIQNGSSHVNSTIRENGRRKATGPTGVYSPKVASCRMRACSFPCTGMPRWIAEVEFIYKRKKRFRFFGIWNRYFFGRNPRWLRPKRQENAWCNLFCRFCWAPYWSAACGRGGPKGLFCSAG